MSVRLRIFSNYLMSILLFCAVAISGGFLLFWFAASPYVGERLIDNSRYIAARYFSLGGVFVLILTGLAALWIVSVTVRHVTGPLKRLTQAASEIRDGNLSYELAVSGRDEFSELAACFEQMRIRLKDTMRMQEKSEAERRAMMASVTHDLMTPITSILGYSEGILDGVANTPEKTREYAAIIHKKALSLQLLSEDLSLLSRLEGAQLTLNRQEEDLSELVMDMLRDFKIDEPEAVITTDIVPAIHVMIDKDKLARVLSNIFQNSAKYKRPEQAGPELSVTLSVHGEAAVLTVSDRGIGVTQDDLPYLFDRFYRADASRGQQSGSGLGLTIARQLVNLHDGKIWILSNPQGGITVNISLPVGGMDF